MLYNLALEAGKKRLSEQTFFVHQGDLIPVVDNFLYALALMRTKVADRILEARDLIERLLPYQLPSGNFPINLHEWPNCNDRFLGAQLLIPMHWITTEFATVLGATLQEKLLDSQARLKDYLIKTEAEKPGSDLIDLKVMACCNNPSLENLLSKKDPWLFEVPKHLGELLMAYQLIDPSLKRFIPYLQDITHPTTHLYAGPSINEYQNMDHAETTLFDLFIAALSGVIPDRVKEDHPCHLWAAAIHPITCEWQPRGKDCNTYHGEVPDSRHKGLHHFRYIWGDHSAPHSLVCQNGNFTTWSFEQEPDSLHFRFDLNEAGQENDRDLAFYLDYQPIEISINGSPATTFNLGDEVVIKTKEKNFTFHFKGEKGLVGHIMRGNRSSQLAIKGEHRYSSFDWVIFLRSVRRSTPYSVDVSLKIT